MVGSVSHSDSSAVVLLSAGLDSSYNLAKARERFHVRLVLTFDYGQRAAKRELERATLLASHYGVRHEIVSVPWFAKFTKTALLGTGEIPVGGGVRIEDHAHSLETAKNVWVPNRNGIFLNIAAGFAEGLGAGMIIPGFNAEEAATFPDNSAAFLRALDGSFAYSTSNHVKTHCFSTKMDKTQIVKEAIALKLPFQLIWPCYFSGESWCGECESCQRFKRAVTANGLNYADLVKEAAE